MSGGGKPRAAGARRVMTRHPDPAKSGARIEKDKYEALRKAILRAVPPGKAGIPFKELPRRVAALLPPGAKARLGSVSWYTVTVKLDLEARGFLERVPGETPQRLRRRVGRGRARGTPRLK